jgi:serine/threonine-protein kinase
MGALKTGGQGSVYKGKRIAGIAETSTPSTSGDVQINAQLNNAEKYLENGRVAEALPMYKNLANVEVPEAMYRYWNLALINSNENISCNEALDFITRAGNKDYVPAKRTLGFLYSFAADTIVLKQYGYERCNLTRNISGGAKLLMEAMLFGDSAAVRFLEELNLKISSRKYKTTQ